MRLSEAEYAALLARDTGTGTRQAAPSPNVLVTRAKALLQEFGDQTAPEPFDVLLRLPWPPSVNASFVYGNRGRMVARKVVWDYRTAVCKAVAAQWPVRLFRPLNQRLALAIVLYPTNARRFDLDNRLKALWDSLSTDHQPSTRPRAGVYLDDSQIDYFCVTRDPVDRQSIPYITVRITPYA